MTEPDPQTEDIFDLPRIRQLIELMKEHELSEIDLRQSDQRIRLCRGGGAPGVLPYAMPPPLPASPPPLPTGSRAPAAPPELAEPNVAYIKSPMVGTFYTRPNPKSEPYVKVGDLIGDATTVCIIEAMKVFNEIPAEVSGRIVAVLVQDEEPVDFGKPLFKVDTSK